MDLSIEKGSIKKHKKEDTSYEKFFLEGLNILQKMSGNVWTDYNEHDPGITILENLSYTLTSLEYKTSFPIKDLLIKSENRILKSGDNALFIPSDILTTNPVTIKDFRRLFIDQLSSAKNIWFKSIDSIRIKEKNSVKGLYHIYIELDVEGVDDNGTDEGLQKAEELNTISKAKELFYKHRNLCEDLFDISILKPIDLDIELNITVNEHENGEKILAGVLNTVKDILANNIKFYSLWELQDEGRDVNEIFNGPRLENGFVPDSELKEQFNTIALTDIVKQISQNESIINVNSFKITSDNKEVNNAIIEKGVIPVSNDQTLNLKFPTDTQSLKIRYNDLEFNANLKDVHYLMDYMRDLEYGAFVKASKSENEIMIPQGEYLDISSYESIIQQFPNVYGINKIGLKPGLPEERYAQAKQLKAYLLPFDQLMANFLAQLENIYDLFDVDNQKIKSYFCQELEDMPEMLELINTSENSGMDNYLEYWKEILNKLNDQFDQNAIVRLNQVADDLLSRFGETLPFNILKKIHNDCYGEDVNNDDYDKELLALKRKFLRNYSDISYTRAKAIEYTNMDSIPGLIQRLAITLGITNIKPRSLAEVIDKSGLSVYYKETGLEIVISKLEKVDAGKQVEVIVMDEIIIVDDNIRNLKKDFCYIGNKESILQEVMKYGIQKQNYEIKSPENVGTPCYVLFKKGEGTKTVVHITQDYHKAVEAINYTLNFLIDLNIRSEGFHLVEHIMLAPPYKGNYYGFSIDYTAKDSEFDIVLIQSKLKPLIQRDEDIAFIQEYILDSSKIVLEPKEITSGKFILEVSRYQEDYDELIAVSQSFYPSREDVERVMSELLQAAHNKQINNVECHAYYGQEKIEESFYSLKMSFVLPSWPARFQSKNFRNKFKEIVHDQAPAHIISDVLWLGLPEMSEFEKNYFNWIKYLKSGESKEEEMNCAFELIKIIKNAKIIQ